MKLLKHQEQTGYVLSVVLDRQFAPVEFGGGGKEIPRCPPCPSCIDGRLQRHGHYFREYQGKEIRIEVLKCSSCPKSHSCQFDFLVPHSQSTAEELGELAEKYLTEETSYDRVGWEVEEEEGEGHRSQAFGVVERLCENREWIRSFVEKQLMRPGETLWRRKQPEAVEEDAGAEEACPNAWKAWKEEKKQALSQLSETLKRYAQSTGKRMAKVIEEMHMASMLLSTPFSLLTCAECPRLSAPKKRRYGSM